MGSCIHNAACGPVSSHDAIAHVAVLEEYAPDNTPTDVTLITNIKRSDRGCMYLVIKYSG